MATHDRTFFQMLGTFNVFVPSQVFRVLEESRNELHLDEYGVCQTLVFEFVGLVRCMR